MAAGHFNNDTYLDIVMINGGSDNVDIFLGHGGDFLPAQPHIQLTRLHRQSLLQITIVILWWTLSLLIMALTI